MLFHNRHRRYGMVLINYCYLATSIGCKTVGLIQQVLYIHRFLSYNRLQRYE